MSTQRIESPGVVKRKLPNGLTVIVKEDHSSPIVAVNMWFGVGSVHETEEMNGLAHFQEHMVFKGTKKYGVGDIGRIVKSAGGNLNAGTSYSYTMYYVVLPSARFDTALEVQADAMMNSTFDPEEFAKERLVVIDEARMYDDRPESFTFYRTMELCFERHTYRRPIAGYQPIVEKITRDQLLEFYNNYYRPANGRLVIVGDIDPEMAFRRAEQVYGAWPDGAVTVNEPPVEPAQKAFRFKAYSGPMDHAYLGAGFHVPGILHADYPALQMLSELLSSGRSSRLYRHVREEKQLVTSVNADLLAEKWPGLMLVAASMPPLRWEPACAAILHEIERFKHEPVPDSELEKARRQVERAMFKELETMEGQASNIGYYELLGDYRLADEHREAIKQVTAEQVMAVARKYLHPDNLSLISYLPHDSTSPGDHLVEKTVRRELSAEGGVRQISDAPAPAPVAETRTVARHATREQTAGEVTRFALPNGVRVLLKQRTNVPLVSLLTVFPGGGRFEPAGKAGLGHLTHRLITKGSAHYSAEEIAAGIEGLGGGIESYSSFDTGGLSMGVLSEYVGEASKIYRDVLLEPLFDGKRVIQEKTRLLEELKRRHDNPVPFAMDHLFEYVFGDHPYAHPFLGSATEVESLTPEDCSTWYRGLLAPEHTVLSIVGDLSVARAREVAGELLGGLQAHPVPAPRDPAPAAPVKPGEHVLRRSGIKQAVTFVGFPAPPMMTDRSWALEVLNGILTGLGGRLFVELRDKRSLGYMTGSAYNAFLQRGIFFGYANPGAEGVDEAVRVILHELDKVTKEPVTDEELARAKEWLLGSHLMQLQRNGAQAAAYGTYEALGYGWEAVDRVPDDIRRVTKDDIIEAAHATFVKDAAVIVRMLPK